MKWPRRQRPAPGVRPPRGELISHRVCIRSECQRPFTLDRARQPWSRAEHCSPRCAKITANENRRPGTCRHCDMVRDYHLQLDADVRAIEVPAQDEDARPVTFREWLETFEWPTWDEPAW